MNEVAKIDPPPVIDDRNAMVSMIERMVMNPNIDVDKLERLLAVKRQIDANEAEAAYNTSMAAAQSEMGRVSADATNPQTRSKYASYGQLDRHLRPVYTKHGFALSFDTGDSPHAEHVRVLCHVSHRGGHSRDHHCDMPADGKGAKGGDVMTKTHAAGSAMSYGMRYLLKLVFNVAIGEDDDDGNSAEVEVLSVVQAATIKKMLADTSSNVAAFLKAMGGYESVDAMPAAIFDKAMRALNKKVANASPG
jgi:hypothetical protein